MTVQQILWLIFDVKIGLGKQGHQLTKAQETLPQTYR